MTQTDSNYNLSDFIVVIRNLVDKQDCASLIEAYKSTDLWEWSGVSRAGEKDIDFDVRKVQQINMSHPQTMQDPKLAEWDTFIFHKVGKARELFQDALIDKGIKHLPETQSDEGYTLLHYKEGYYFKEHADSGINNPRVLTCSINLNEEYEGGQFTFLGESFEIDLGAGDAVIFPSNFMFPHAVKEITSGERYAIVTWLF